nr:hypothetical protein [Rhodococcus sp. (in: high G+C Gram-positive bacteria)]
MADQSGASPATAPSTATDTTETEIDDSTEQQAEEKAAEIDSKYEPGARPTVTLPGTGGMVSGTAFADMVDENGELKDDQNKDDQNKDE